MRGQTRKNEPGNYLQPWSFLVTFLYQDKKVTGVWGSAPLIRNIPPNPPDLGRDKLFKGGIWEYGFQPASEHFGLKWLLWCLSAAFFRTKWVGNPEMARTEGRFSGPSSAQPTLAWSVERKGLCCGRSGRANFSFPAPFLCYFLLAYKRK